MSRLDKLIQSKAKSKPKARTAKVPLCNNVVRWAASRNPASQVAILEFDKSPSVDEALQLLNEIFQDNGPAAASLLTNGLIVWRQEIPTGTMVGARLLFIKQVGVGWQPVCFHCPGWINCREALRGPTDYSCRRLQEELLLAERMQYGGEAYTSWSFAGLFPLARRVLLREFSLEYGRGDGGIKQVYWREDVVERARRAAYSRLQKFARNLTASVFGGFPYTKDCTKCLSADSCRKQPPAVFCWILNQRLARWLLEKLTAKLPLVNLPTGIGLDYVCTKVKGGYMFVEATPDSEANHRHPIRFCPYVLLGFLRRKGTGTTCAEALENWYQMAMKLFASTAMDQFDTKVLAHLTRFKEIREILEEAGVDPDFKEDHLRFF